MNRAYFLTSFRLITNPIDCQQKRIDSQNSYTLVSEIKADAAKRNQSEIAHQVPNNLYLKYLLRVGGSWNLLKG